MLSLLNLFNTFAFINTINMQSNCILNDLKIENFVPYKRVVKK